MAEYYPLISRAVASLRGGAPQARQAIYGRARHALVAQLRGMKPPVPEEAINKEITALDAAIERIEAELVPPEPAFAPPTPPAPAPEVVPGPAVSAAPPVPEASAGHAVARPEPVSPAITPASPAGPATRPSMVRPPAPPVASTEPARTERAMFERRPSLPAARPLPPRSIRPPAPARTPVADSPTPVGDHISEPLRTAEAPIQAQRPVAPNAEALGPAANPPEVATAAGEPPRFAPAPVLLPTAPTLATTDLARNLDEPAISAPVIRARSDADDRAQEPPVPDILAGETRGRDEALRPAIPRPTERAPRDLRVWIVAVAALAVLAAIALMAWKLRDDPEQLARSPAPTQTEPAAGKIAERADGPAEEADADAAAPALSSAPAVQTSTPPGAAPQSAADQGIAVAYKAAILVAAPDTPEKVRTYVGTVVWRTESVAEAQGQPLGTAVRADIDVPDAKLQAVMELRKNTEAQFPASHTIDLKFTIGADSPIGNIKQIDVPRTRSEDAAAGDPLVGVPVTITTNYFLVGLTRGAAEQRNMDALRTAGWIDVPMVLDNGTPAKITFEKGALGQQILGDALQAWNHS